MKNRGILDPVSNTPITNAVIISHPSIAPYTYNRQSVIDAIAQNELERFGINAENINDFVFTDQFTQEIIEAMEKSNGRIETEKLDELYKEPITFSYPCPPAILCTQDGRLYEQNSLFSVMVANGRSPFNRQKIRLNKDLCNHLAFEHLQKTLDSHSAPVLNLRETFKEFKHVNNTRISFQKSQKPTVRHQIRITLATYADALIHTGRQHHYFVQLLGRNPTNTFLAIPTGFAYMQCSKAMHVANNNMHYHPKTKKYSNNTYFMLYGALAALSWYCFEMETWFDKKTLLSFSTNSVALNILCHTLSTILLSSYFFRYRLFAKTFYINKENFRNDVWTLTTRPLNRNKLAKLFLFTGVTTGVFAYRYLHFSDNLIFAFHTTLLPSLATARMIKAAIKLPYDLGITYMGYTRLADLFQLNGEQTETLRQRPIETGAFHIASTTMFLTMLLGLYSSKKDELWLGWLTLLFTFCELSIPHMMEKSLPVMTAQEPKDEDLYVLGNNNMAI